VLLRNLPQAVEKFHKIVIPLPFLSLTLPLHPSMQKIHSLHYTIKKKSFPYFWKPRLFKVNHLRSILDYIDQEQLTTEKRNHFMKLSKKIHREKTIQPTVNLNDSAFFCNLLLTLFFVAIRHYNTPLIH